MQADNKDLVVRHDEQNRQFYALINGQKAFLDYEIRGGKIYITYTEVPIALRHRGIGSALVSKSVEELKGWDQKIIPVCGFVANWFDENRIYQNLLDL